MATDGQANISRNAIALTLRMVFVTAISLYTSRVVINALGLEDYGLYSVIGSIIGFASFLNMAMAGGTTRFITVELGKGNEKSLNAIFSSALQIHILLAICVLVLTETVGLWFLNTQMVIPEGRIMEANILYQLSALSMIISFTQSPYTAEILAHERMSIYAGIEVLSALLKLAIAIFISTAPSDRLIIYASLGFLLTTSTAIYYRIYCIRNFREARLSRQIHKREAIAMLKFSAMDLYGNLCIVAKNQGLPVVLNLFFGVIANAAAGIAAVISGTLQGFTSAISLAFVPRITKLNAANDIEQMERMMRNSIVFSFLAFGSLAIPLVLFTPEILQIWLGEAPPFSVIFTRLLIGAALFSIIINCSHTAIRANGDIRFISFGNGTLYLLTPIVAYILLKCGLPAESLYATDMVMQALIALCGVIILKHQIRQVRLRTYLHSIFGSLTALFGAGAIAEILRQNIHLGSNAGLMQYLLIICLIALCGAIALTFLSLIFAMDSQQRAFLANKARRFFTNQTL